MSDFPNPLPETAPPPPPSAQNLDIPDEAYGVRTASQWLEPGDELNPAYKDEVARKTLGISLPRRVE